ncbi:hypothetical protein GCM10010466_23430 [Planomonospora alba]|uniref:Uncharacterized protein n=1 Tax=Planomonospora alba TaxID=161354 RepID=A0ABP6N0B6_9ACTN
MRAVERGNGHVGIPPGGHRPERPVGHEGLGGHISGTLGLPRGFTLSWFIRGHDPVVSSPGGLGGGSQMSSVASFAHPIRSGGSFPADRDRAPVPGARADHPAVRGIRFPHGE